METIDIETWKPIPDFPGYEVSDHGRVRSYFRRIHAVGRKGCDWEITEEPQRILKGSFDPNGYHFVVLGRHAIRHTKRVHCLVMEAFAGPCPDDLEVCHGDGNPTNNHLGNLRYDTHHANMLEGKVTKLSFREIYQIRQARSEGASPADLAKRFNVSRSTISAITTGRRYSHVGGKIIPQKRSRPMDSANLWEVLKSKGVTARQLAETIGISESYLSHLRTGRRDWTPWLMKETARVLQVPESKLFCKQSPPAPASGNGGKE